MKLRSLVLTTLLVAQASPITSAAAVVVKPPAQTLPTRIAACVITRVKWVGERLGDSSTNEQVAGSGSAIDFTNGGGQVSYEQVAAVDGSRPGDRARMCLIHIPHHCPPGDDRGRVYRTTNLRTGKSWELPDAEHMCGGA